MPAQKADQKRAKMTSQGQSFTDRWVRSLKPRAKRYDVVKLRTYGKGSLVVRVNRNGSKTFMVRYKWQRKDHSKTLGKYPRMSVSEAMSAFAALGDLLDQGIDPSGDKRLATARSRKGLTVGGLAKTYLEKYAKPRKRSWKEDERQLNHDVLPRWGTRVAAGIRRRDVQDLLDEIVSRGAGVQANRTLALIRRMFRWAVEQDILESSPCAYVRAPTRE